MFANVDTNIRLQEPLIIDLSLYPEFQNHGKMSESNIPKHKPVFIFQIHVTS